MFEISKNELSITKGDSAYIDVEITDKSGNPYSMKATDSLKMSVAAAIGTTPIMYVESNTSTLHITHDQSALLPVGKCFFDVQLKIGDDVYTLAGPVDEYIPNMTVYPEVTGE